MPVAAAPDVVGPAAPGTALELGGTPGLNEVFASGVTVGEGAAGLVVGAAVAAGEGAWDGSDTTTVADVVLVTYRVRQVPLRSATIHGWVTHVDWLLEPPGGICE